MEFLKRASSSQFGLPALSSLGGVLIEEIILPALAASRYEEPVIVESDSVTSKLVVTITVDIST